MACTGEEDPIWEAVNPTIDPFAIVIKASGTDPRFAANVKVFHADGDTEVFNDTAKLGGPGEKSKILGSPGLTNVVIARVIIDDTSSADTRLEVNSTIGSRSHCHAVTAKGVTTMVHTIRMK